MVRLGFCIALLFAACAATQARPNLPGTFGSGETLPPPVAPEADGALAPVAVPAVPAPAAGTAAVAPDPGAEADFREAKARFDAGAQADARKALEGFVAHHGQHPFRPAVDLMLARLALLRGDAAGAKRQLEPLVATPPDPGTASSARYYLGISEVRLGQYARGRELLLPFLPAAGAAGPGDEALVELRGALAEATSATGELTAALELWDGFARGGRDHEKAYARSRAGELAADVAPDAAARAWRASAERGLARAVLGTKAAAYVRAQGDAQGAAAIDAETAAARKAMGFEEAQAAQGSGDTGRLGLAIALTGKFQPVGEAAMRAAMLAVGAPTKVAMATPSPAPSGAMQLYVRDTGGEPERASRGVAELAHDEAVIGILSATDRKAAATSLAAASENGVPTLALDDTPPGATSTAFQLIHAPEARVAALARAALKAGARDFAMLGPDSAAGKRLRDAFRREVTGAGGRITGDASYAPGATSFGTQVAAIKRTPPQVVFVADGADRLELIAPALAAADLWAAPWGAARPAGAPGAPRPRNVLLLSTAAEPSPRLLQNAGRYLQGALLAPGFYAASGDARARAFVEAYRATYGSDPHATEAYAYDGANAFRAVTAAGARTRGDVLNALGAGTFEGLTGALRFGPDHGRIDPPRLYVISGDEIKPAP